VPNVSRTKTWVSDEVLTAAHLNAEFNGILAGINDNALDNDNLSQTDDYLLRSLVLGSGVAAGAGDGQLHVHVSSAGSVAAHADANDLVVESSANTGMTLLSGASATGSIHFGDTDNDVGSIVYTHGTDMAFTVETVEVLTLATASVTNNVNTFVGNGFGAVIGHTAQETISDGGGATDVVPEFQILGTAAADMTAMIGGWSTTATRAAAPVLALAKSGHASIGSHTVVTDGEILGSIIAYGDDGTDIESPAAAIEFAVDGTPGTGDMPGEIKFYTTADGGETLTLGLTLSAAQAATFAGAVTVASLACTAAGTFGGGYGSTGATISTAGVIQANGAITSDGAVTGATLAGTISTAAQNSITSASSLATVGTVTSGTWSTGAVIGGATVTVGSDATGDVYYRNASGVFTRLAVGSDADVLTLASGIPSWATPTTGDITGVTAGTGLSGGGSSGGVTLALDLSELTDTAIANGDYIVFTDSTDSNATVKGDLADVATLFAGTGLTASSSVISIDAAQTGIDSLLATDIKIGEDDQTKIDFGTANEIAFVANNSTAMYITSTGGVVHGHTDAVFNSGMELIESAAGTAFDISVHSTTDTDMGQIRFRKSASATVDGDGVATADGESFGRIAAMGTRSTPAYAFSASIDFEQDGSVGATAAPGRILFSTAAGGSALAEVMRIDSSKLVTVADDLHVGGDVMRVSAGAGTRMEIISSAGRSWRIGDGVGTSNGIFTIYDATASLGRVFLDSNGMLGIGDAANANMTQGLTINQGSADNEILTLKSSSDVSAGTIASETDTFGYMKKVTGGGGGLVLSGVSDPGHDADSPSLMLFGYSDDSFTNNNKSSASSRGRVEFFAFQHNSAGATAALAANTNAFAFRGGTGTSSASRSLVIIDEDGDLYSITSAQTFDAHDDVALVSALDMAQAPDQIIKTEWEDFTKYNEQALIDAKILGAPVSEGGLTNQTQLARLHNGAIRQLGRGQAEMKADFSEALDQRDTKIALLEQRLNRLEN